MHTSILPIDISNGGSFFKKRILSNSLTLLMRCFHQEIPIHDAHDWGKEKIQRFGKHSIHVSYNGFTSNSE